MFAYGMVDVAWVWVWYVNKKNISVGGACGCCGGREGCWGASA